MTNDPPDPLDPDFYVDETDTAFNGRFWAVLGCLACFLTGVFFNYLASHR